MTAKMPGFIQQFAFQVAQPEIYHNIELDVPKNFFLIFGLWYFWRENEVTK